MPARIRDGEQHPERRRHRAEDVGKTQQHQAHNHQPRLAEQIGRSTEHRLYDRKGEGEDGGENWRQYAMLTLKSSATCGNTGSSARADRLAANVAGVMILRAGGRRLEAVTAASASLALPYSC